MASRDHPRNFGLPARGRRGLAQAKRSNLAASLLGMFGVSLALWVVLIELAKRAHA